MTFPLFHTCIDISAFEFLSYGKIPSLIYDIILYRCICIVAIQTFPFCLMDFLAID
ncbi:hypothetical protein L228DRAFT_249667, partial [Xylona heveae TC161]